MYVQKSNQYKIIKYQIIYKIMRTTNKECERLINCGKFLCRILEREPLFGIPDYLVDNLAF